MKKSFLSLSILSLLYLPVTAFGQDITLDVLPYRYGDSVIVGVKVSIPKGFNLYANPLGPGIGKPLNLFVNKIDSSVSINVAWTEARKSAPRRYDPPIGDWVWAYSNEAYFFVKGKVDRESTCADCYEIIIDALICKTSCIPIVKRASFGLPFHKELSWQAQFVKSEPMAFKVGAPESGSLSFDSKDDGGAALDIDLGGLSSLGGIKLSGDDGQDDGRSGTSAPTAAFVGDDDDNDIEWDYSPVEDRRDYNFLTAILFALLAGLAMNLTPCIFPMLGVRALSFAQSANESRRRAVYRSVMFSFGIVAVFLLLAALAAFAGLSWGQQFQNPAVMVGIISMVFFFALGMFDFYTLAAPSAVGNAERSIKATLFGDVLKGAAATVMATPCAGPFLGALLAWALLQEPLVIFAVFAVMGVGMSLPYILLASSRKLMKLLPRPGRWIEDFKHAMGFLLLVFAVILMKSLDPSLTLVAVGIAVSILVAASVNKRFAQFGDPSARRLSVAVISLALLAIGIFASVKYLRVDPPPAYGDGQSNYTQSVGYENFVRTGDDIINPTDPIWINFSPRALQAAHDDGRNVIVNFTASWCTNCKLNYAAVLDTEAARRLYKDKNIVLLTADITNSNPPAESLLRHLGSRSIPFIAIFPAVSPKNPIIMRDILSKDKYLEVLKNLP